MFPILLNLIVQQSLMMSSEMVHQNKRFYFDQKLALKRFPVNETQFPSDDHLHLAQLLGETGWGISIANVLDDVGFSNASLVFCCSR